MPTRCHYCGEDLTGRGLYRHQPKGAGAGEFLETYCNYDCWDQEGVETEHDAQVDRLHEVEADYHMVKQLLTFEQAIEVPGCVGVVLVFLNRDAAVLYVSGLDEADRCEIEPWGIKA